MLLPSKALLWNQLEDSPRRGFALRVSQQTAVPRNKIR